MYGYINYNQVLYSASYKFIEMQRNPRIIRVQVFSHTSTAAAGLTNVSSLFMSYDVPCVQVTKCRGGSRNF